MLYASAKKEKKISFNPSAGEPPERVVGGLVPNLLERIVSISTKEFTQTGLERSNTRT
jgi:hypothetical protein